MDKLSAFMEKLGISISVLGQATIVQDRDRDKNLPDLRLEDIDNLQAIEEFPPATEYQLIFDNPAYLEEEQRLYKERRDKAEAAQKEKTSKALKEKEKREQEELKQKELRERKLLATLKEKYEVG